MDPVVDTTLRAALAVLFLVAATHKLRDLGRFRSALAAYRVLPEPLTTPGTGFVVGIEVAVAAALVAPAFRMPGSLSAAGLLVVYGAAIAINLARGRRDLDCGCAGPSVRRPISGWLVARNAALAGVALVGLVPVQARPLLWVDALTVVGGIAVLTAFYVTLDRMIADTPALVRLRGDA